MATAYCTVKRNILQQSNKYSKEDISLLKHKFSCQINSARRLDNICNIGDLISLLEKRNVINEYSFNCLKEIATALNVNINNDSKTIKDTTPGRHSKHREEIYELICSELGMQWREFGRALKLNDAKIDELEDGYKLLSERIRRILMYYDSESNSTTWTPILEALSRSRRNDLCIQIHNILHQ